MDTIYIIILLIGFFCVLSVIVIHKKVSLDDKRRERCTKEKNRERYEKRIKLFGNMKKVVVFALVADIFVVIARFIIALTNNSDVSNGNNNSIETVKLTSINLQERLGHNWEEKVKIIFDDYLFFSWFEGDEKRTKEYYKQKLDEMLDGKEPVSDMPKKMLEEEKRKAYDEYHSQLGYIDEEKVPEGNTLEQVQKCEVLPKELDVETYKKEYDLWNKCNLLCPTADNLQQMARAALDVQTVMIRYAEYRDNWDEIIEYARHGIEGYLSLLFYTSSKESKADCCYWIAKTYYDLAQNMPDEYSEYVEHCYLMAYTFAEKGLSYKNTDGQKDDHILDIEKIRNHADKALEVFR